MPSTPDRARWQQLWLHLGAPPALAHGADANTCYEQLCAAYAEPQRHYHGLQHLTECLSLFDTAADTAQRPEEIELALWFHDAIYIPQRGDNEARSAAWAVATLATMGLTAAACAALSARVEAAILATRHDGAPPSGDAQLLVDIDLAILGASPVRFAEYETQIRAEYAWVDEAEFRRKRRSVLAAFAARDPLYQTVAIRRRCETAARRNLQHALAAV